MCLRLLTVRARTRAELAGQLAKRGYPDDVANAVLDRLEAVGLIDDEDFAEQWVRSRQANAGKASAPWLLSFGPRASTDEVIAAALDGIDAGAERGRAEQLVERRLRREVLGDGDDAKVMRRLVGMLARRGYSQSMAVAVVTEAVAAERERRRVSEARGWLTMTAWLKTSSCVRTALNATACPPPALASRGARSARPGSLGSSMPATATMTRSSRTPRFQCSSICGAPWCGSVPTVSPALEQLATERAGRLKLVKVNVEHCAADLHSIRRQGRHRRC